MPTAAPYGSWRSPITAASIAAGGVSLSIPDVVDGDVYWLEGKPLEAGRVVLVRQAAHGSRDELTPRPFSVRTRAHEYGGGAYAVHGRTVYFSNFTDQRLYRQDPGAAPRPITPEASVASGLRYADACLSHDGSLLICVRERHATDGSGASEATNELVALPADGSGEAHIIAAGHDFYSSPRIGPDGRQLAWLVWDHPRMPWDGSEVWIGELATDGSISNPRRVAGGENESIFQPDWSPSGELHFASDRTGWWNLYRVHNGSVAALAPMAAEFGTPQWVFGMSTYAFLPDGRIACIISQDGIDRLAFIRPGQRARVETADLPYTAFVRRLRACGHTLVFIAASPTEASAVVRLDAQSGARDTLRRSLDQDVDPAYISPPRSISFPSEGGQATAYALYYPPANADFVGPAGERPPLIVESHGGPTAMTQAQLNLDIQYWTLAIRGGSAGGYTTLCALVFHNDFAAGASYYGVADCEALATDTHKFESRYLDGLIGPYPAARDIYRARSPIHFADQLSCPVILFQGLEDRVVPPSQAERMVEALRAKDLPFAYLAFEGEQHGFRKAETIQRTLEAELYFYARVFRFPLAQEIEPVEIENLP